MSLQWFAEWYVNLHRKKEPMRHRQLPLKQTRINFTVAHLSLCVDIEMAVCFQRVQISHKHKKKTFDSLAAAKARIKMATSARAACFRESK